MKELFTIITLAAVSLCSIAQKRVLSYDIFDEINSTTWTYTQSAFEKAEEMKADCVILHLNTYGGEVVYADSIRTKILNAAIPVYAFIDNNAASAGSLISIACDSIYMRRGANIGACSVVNESGEKMPDKYQSYMRSTMRSTAESHGRRMDDSTRWVRDPRIAEAMVDEFIGIPNVVDSGKILTFTTDEAIANGYCEGKASTVEEVAHIVAGDDCKITYFRPTVTDSVKGWLNSSALRGILILIILGGIYFELQTPGVGFPTIAAVAAGILYFAPLYIDGLAANWEILMFVVGIVLIAVEIFVIPGFGFTGIGGIVCVVIGLSFSMLDNDGFDFSNVESGEITRSALLVGGAVFVSIIGGLFLTNYLIANKKTRIAALVLDTDQTGYVGTDTTATEYLGHEGVAVTDLRPSGKIKVDEVTLDAISTGAFISKGSKIKVKEISEGQAVCEKCE